MFLWYDPDSHQYRLKDLATGDESQVDSVDIIRRGMTWTTPL